MMISHMEIFLNFFGGFVLWVVVKIYEESKIMKVIARCNLSNKIIGNCGV